MKHFVALVALSAIAACAQIPPPAYAWGEPVEGVQLRVALAKSLPVRWYPPPPDRLLKAMPVFELQIRNRGALSITIDPHDMSCPSTEIDDVWYVDMCVVTGGGAGSPMDIAPGSMGRVFLVSVQIPKSRKGMDTTDGKVLTLISNRVAIDIPASTTAQIKP